MTYILGLTGSIGMGKSTTSGFFRERGVPVHDADASVHKLYRGRAVPAIEAAFSGVVVQGVVDRAKLSSAVVGKPEALKKLEAIIHPLVRREEQAFIARCRAAGHGLAVLDVPLLLETGGQDRCDAVCVITAGPEIQRARVLARPEMTPAKFEAILARQMPDGQKRRHAHFLVDTGRGLLAAQRQVASILTTLAGRPGRGTSAKATADA
jgi:dephospho-CoA kinase